MSHLLTYYTWKSRRSWRLDSLAQGDGDTPALRYIFREVGTWKKYAEPGAVLWVVGLSPAGCPTLDARIHVDPKPEGVYHRRRIDPRSGKRRRWRGVRGSSPPSRYFGLNDAREAMARIAFVNARKKTWRLARTDPARSWRSQHGGRLQNVLRIAPPMLEVPNQEPSPGIAPLERLAQTCLRRSLFISYKHADFESPEARRFLDRLAAELARAGLSVWLDRVALTGSGGQKPGRQTARQLGALLSQGLEQSRTVLGVWRQSYGTRSRLDGRNWTRREWQGHGRDTRRIALDPRRSYSPRPGLEEPSARVLLPADPRPAHAAAVAARIARKVP